MVGRRLKASLGRRDNYLHESADEVMRGINGELGDTPSPLPELGTMYFHQGSRANLTISFRPKFNRKSMRVNIFQYQSRGVGIDMDANEMLSLYDWLGRYFELHKFGRPGS